jgi:hypothetical protein
LPPTSYHAHIADVFTGEFRNDYVIVVGYSAA